MFDNFLLNILVSDPCHNNSFYTCHNNIIRNRYVIKYEERVAVLHRPKFVASAKVNLVKSQEAMDSSRRNISTLISILTDRTVRLSCRSYIIELNLYPYFFFRYVKYHKVFVTITFLAVVNNEINSCHGKNVVHIGCFCCIFLRKTSFCNF